MRKTRICIIGPFPPIKGGISQYDDFLVNELKKESEVYCISYKRQYPKFLVKNREQIDENYKENLEVDFCIDSVNPFTWITALNKVRKFKPDLVILPWWVVYWVPMYVLFLTYFKINRIKSLFICHNIYEHEDHTIKQLFSKMTLNMANIFLVHSETEKNKLSNIIVNKKIVKHLLPIYKFSTLDTKIQKKESNEKLKLLFFGFIREYKGLDLLLEALRMVNDKEIHLTIVGEFWNGSDNYVEFIKIHNLQNITIVDQYVPDKEISKYFLSTDVIVLPYRHATGSAVIPVAYSYNKPVLVTNVGGLPEAVLNEKTGYIVDPNPYDIANGIKWFIKNKEQNFTKEIESFVASSMSWSSLVENIYSLIEKNGKNY